MYRVVVHPAAAAQIAELPAAALVGYAEVHDAIELAPWNGASHNERNPDGAVRR